MKAFKFFGLGVATLVVGLGMSGAPREAEACCGDGAIAAARLGWGEAKTAGVEPAAREQRRELGVGG